MRTFLTLIVAASVILLIALITMPTEVVKNAMIFAALGLALIAGALTAAALYLAAFIGCLILIVWAFAPCGAFDEPSKQD
jgi:hypothetical protein